MMEDQNRILYSEEVLGFVRLAKEYCTLLETELNLSREIFTRFILYNLPAVYSAMIRIPVIEPYFEEGNEKFVTEQDWSEVYRKVAACMAENNEFLDIPAESEFDRSELVTRYISEDLADIYQDLRDFLEVYRNSPEDVMNDALWECQGSFTGSWGAKILRVSTAMHRQFSASGITAAESEEEDKQENTRNIDTRDWFISRRQEEFRDDENDFFTEHQH